jgi:hypothetical protein
MSQDNSFFNELMSLFRRRGEMLASGFSLDITVVVQRQQFRETFDAFVQLSDARRAKLYEVCKRTHWTIVTKESLLATFAAMRVTAARPTPSNVMFLWMVCDLKMKEYLTKTVVPRAQLRQLASIDQFSMLPQTCADAFILCRAVTPPIAFCGAHFIAEDRLGNVFWVHLATFPYNSPAWASLKVREGAVVAVNAPTLFLTKFGWDPMIRCVIEDNFVPIHDLSSPLLQDTPWFVAPCETALAWKQRGNECFKRLDFDGAIAAYARGLELESGNVDLLSNRANALIQRGKWGAALADADRVLEIDANHLKCARFRATVLGKQRRYGDAASAWMRAALLYRDSHDVSAECTANAAKAMVAHRQTEGVFDWPAIAADIFGNRFVELATFVNPSTHVAPTTIKGRDFGMFARVAIPRGTLLVVESPLLQTVAESDSSCDDWLVEAEKDELTNATLTELYESSVQVDVDIAAFGVRVRSVCSTHTSVFRSEWYALERPKPSGLGLFVTATRFNHSCEPNCTKTLLGSVLIIQAAVDIPAGSELFVAHCPLEKMLPERTAALAERNTLCHCHRCRVEATDPTLVKIGKRVQELSDHIVGGKPLRKQVRVPRLIDDVLSNPQAIRSFGIVIAYVHGFILIIVCISQPLTQRHAFPAHDAISRCDSFVVADR